MDSQSIYSVKYNDNIYSISGEIIKKIGILSGLLDAGITDLELPLIQSSESYLVVQEFLQYLSDITASNQKLDIAKFIIFSLTGEELLDEYIKKIKDDVYDDNTIRKVNYRAFILLHAVDYWDFRPVITQIREYISQFIKVCDIDTINRWLGGII